MPSRACGDDFPVSIRYSVVKTKGLRQGALPGEQFVEAGRDMAESIEAARYLADAGCDMFNCDSSTYDAWYWATAYLHAQELQPRRRAELRRHPTCRRSAGHGARRRRRDLARNVSTPQASLDRSWPILRVSLSGSRGRYPPVHPVP
ncbi:MAG: hypothetical protein ACLTXI_01305 [Collinsella sp.]